MLYDLKNALGRPKNRTQHKQESLSSGIVEFSRNWDASAPPAIALSGGVEVTGFALAPALAAAKTYRYFLEDPATIAFALPLRRGGGINPSVDKVYVAGAFNGWQAAVGDEAWLLRLADLDGEQLLLCTGPAAKVMGSADKRFKFVTGENQWLHPRDDAPNCVRDDTGNINRVLDPAKTGAHLWRFELGASLDLAAAWSVAAGTDLSTGSVPLVPGDFFFDLGTDLPLGAIVSGRSTTFRIFAPRAESVTLHALPAATFVEQEVGRRLSSCTEWRRTRRRGCLGGRARPATSTDGSALVFDR